MRPGSLRPRTLDARLRLGGTVVFWLADQVNGSDVEQLYGSWEGRRQDFHDWVELGERAALALAAENPPRESK